ncbi:MAG: hypothetical protein BGO76_01090 [Caedibacter sp. 38-128]|nr:histidine phosphatase family protein [Holosporales bacterium]OJX05735.1 MAG: hypothetical protein BGO76_01090 [Caedibacter sp. 38-128]
MLPLKPFYFIRHGETEWNRQGIIMGQTDIPLNATGIKQAHKAKDILGQENFSIIYTSPLQRAYQTAQILIDDLEKDIVSEDLLKERYWGELEGVPRAHVKELMAQDRLSDAETFVNFEARVLKALCQILNTSHVTPLIVAHSGVFIALTKMMGYSSLRTSNCIPFLFKPPEHKTHPWVICNLSGEETL